ncbi:hypothetical protein [Microbulbifer sp. SAOS-129_SWC]|uniref:hypothetical protein n=1 Tax=Microbulbifer sp. SAOS-129_SWC TaxID=3145235 RepID=UPI0032174EF7
MLSDFLSGLKQSGAAVNNVVYLGAGACPDFPKIKELQPANIVLVEANRRIAGKLKSACEDDNNVVVLEKLVVAEGEKESRLLVTNLPSFSSVLEPEALSEYYPNIRIVHRDIVSSITLPEICEEYAIGMEVESHMLETASRAMNVLIVDLPGYEVKLISSCSPKLLTNFDRILCRVSKEVLYAESQSLTELNATFHRAHFVTEVEDGPDYPFASLTASQDNLSRLYSKLEEAKAKNSEQKQQLNNLRTELKEVKSSNSEQKQQLKNLRVELQEAKERNEKLKQNLTSVRGELQESRNSEQALVKEKEQVQREYATLHAEMTALREKHVELESLVENSTREFQASLQSKKDELDELSELKKHLEADCERLKKDNQELKYRRDLIDQEVFKVESQLELIKDIVLRDKAF